jgi:hypothetical protein
VSALVVSLVAAWVILGVVIALVFGRFCRAGSGEEIKP